MYLNMITNSSLIAGHSNYNNYAQHNFQQKIIFYVCVKFSVQYIMFQLVKLWNLNGVCHPLSKVAAAQWRVNVGPPSKSVAQL